MSARLAYRFGLMTALLAANSVGLAASTENQPIKPQLQIAMCLACHGTEGMKADPSFRVPKIGRQHADYIVSSLKAYRSGTRKSVFMQTQVAGLSDAEIQELAEYFSATPEERSAPGRPPDKHPSRWVQVCGACHGETGLGNMPGYPILASQYDDYLLHALRDYRSGNREHPFMPLYARTLSESELQEIASYLGSQRADALVVGVAPVTRAIESIVMVDIPAGEFLMGSADVRGFNIGRPEHAVQIRGFRMGKYAVTFEQYDAFAQDTDRVLPSDEGWGRGRRPVINVTLRDTLDFVAWLNRKTGRHYRLPSEAEREYAARAGTSTTFWWGDTMDPEYVNGNGVKGRDQWKFTAPVGQFPANSFGLHDMAGNVWERTADCWHGSYDGAPSDGTAWIEPQCHGRVARGSYWDIPRQGHSTRYRAIAADAYSGSGLGFRLAQDN